MILDSFKYVTSGLTLVAFLGAIVAWSVRGKTEERERLIKGASDDRRAQLVKATLEFFDVDTSGLTREQRYDLALRQIEARSKRFATIAKIVMLGAGLFAALTGYALYNEFSPLPPGPKQPDTDVNFVTEIKGPFEMTPGKTEIVPISLPHDGAVEVTLEKVNPLIATSNSPEVYVKICASSTDQCREKQLAQSVPLATTLPKGNASVQLFNFTQNPSLAITLKITHPG